MLLINEICQGTSRFICRNWHSHNLMKCRFHTSVLETLRQQNKGTGKWTDKQKRLRSTVYYVAATAVLTVGMSYAAVPLYRMFCQVY